VYESEHGKSARRFLAVLSQLSGGAPDDATNDERDDRLAIRGDTEIATPRMCCRVVVRAAERVARPSA